MGRHINLIKRAALWDSNPWSKWADPDAPEPKLTSDDLEGAPSGASYSPSSASVVSAGAGSQQDIESLVDEFLASRGSSGNTSSGVGNNITQNLYMVPGMYPYQQHRPRNIKVDIEGNVSGKDLSKILKYVSKMSRGSSRRMPYGMMPMMPYGMMPMMPYGMMPMMHQPKQDSVPTAVAGADSASTLRDFIAYAKSKGIDLSGATPATVAAIENAVPAVEVVSADSEKKYSEADLEKKKNEIDKAVSDNADMQKRYGEALDKAMEDRRTNKARWDRYRRWSPAISAASTIGGGILADKLYSNYILKGKDPALQSNWEWWQRFLAARAGNVGGYLLAQIPNRLMRPSQDMSELAYPTPSDIK